MNKYLKILIPVIIVIIAFVLLASTFGTFGGPFYYGGLSPLTTARNACANAGHLSCVTNGNFPDTWTGDSVGPSGETCEQLLPGCICENNEFLC
ncbi:MAG: hypothetical protein KAS04_02815 [Candidatus Aenigmarchaeota archaeon]|nr:hypothetical protein [Candidatus Aenigmarchaeota archaeon]